MAINNTQKRTILAIVNAFETARALGDYGNVTVIKGDQGHLTYGRSQTTLGSGNLAKLMDRYCDAPGARFAAQLRPFLPQFQARDTALDKNLGLHQILRDAGEDPVMVVVQDKFFDDVYFSPAVNICQTMGITTALGHAVVYDSVVHGSWDMIRQTTDNNRGHIEALGENAWVKAYLETRKAWVLREPQPFAEARNTVFRMNDLLAQVNANNWDLKLPFTMHEVRIDDKVVAAPLGKSPASGSMVQGNFGNRGNFELVIPHPDGGMAYLSRDNDVREPAWTALVRFGGAAAFAGPGMIQSTFNTGGNKGNFEVVARTGGQAVLFWRGDSAPFAWNGPINMPAGVFNSVDGNAALMQGNSGVQGNFELVMPRHNGGFSHYWRDNDTAGFPWQISGTVGAGDGVIESLAMIEPEPGSIEVIVRFAGGALASYRRGGAPGFAWGPASPIPLTNVPAGAHATGTLAAIKGRFGANGNYELITPLSSGGLASISRVNDNPAAPVWTPATLFATDAGQVDAVSLVQSNFGPIGSLEVVAVTGRRALHYWRSDTTPFAWSTSSLVAQF